MKTQNKTLLPVIVLFLIAFSGFELKAATTTLNLKCFIEGFYNPVTNQMIKPVPVTVTLVSYPPFYTEYSNSAVIDINGNATVNIDIPSSSGYWVKIRNWNIVETWNSSPFVFTIGGTTDIDLTLYADSTYGSNARQIDFSPVRWGIFSGDVNQDMVVDGSDGSLVYNDSYNYASGNLTNDLSGDEIIDVDDLLLWENNSNEFIGTIRP